MRALFLAITRLTASFKAARLVIDLLRCLPRTEMGLCQSGPNTHTAKSFLPPGLRGEALSELFRLFRDCD